MRYQHGVPMVAMKRETSFESSPPLRVNTGIVGSRPTVYQGMRPYYRRRFKYVDGVRVYLKGPGGVRGTVDIEGDGHQAIRAGKSYTLEVLDLHGVPPEAP